MKKFPRDLQNFPTEIAVYEKGFIMKELSLNILDIAMNSVKAGAKNIAIRLTETSRTLTLSIEDDGCGMTEEQILRLRDPFYTTRTTRKVGLGVPFLSLAAEQTGGKVDIVSRCVAEHPEDHGTAVTALFYTDSIDFTPLGDVISTIVTLIQGNPELDFIYQHSRGDGEVLLSCAEMREQLGDVPLNEPAVLSFVSDYLAEHYEALPPASKE